MDYYEVNKTIYAWGSVDSLQYLRSKPIHIVPKQQITCHLQSEELVK